MSLKAWYPLINNLYKNQGTCFGGDSYTSPAFGTTESRLGTSSYTGGNISWTKDQTAKIFNNNALSVAFWIYPISETATGIIFGIDANPRRFALYQYSSDPNKHGSTLHWSWDPGDSYVAGKRVSATIANAMPIGVWTHICVTYQKGIGGRVYINGRLSESFAFESAVSDFSTAACTVYCNSAVRLLNDFRVYDHCLSPLEVHNLAQGLLCHYTFDGWHPESENEFVTLVGNAIGSGISLSQESDGTFRLTSTTTNTTSRYGYVYWKGGSQSTLAVNTDYVFSCEVYNASNSAIIQIHTENGEFKSSNWTVNSAKKRVTCDVKNKWVTIYGILRTGNTEGFNTIMFYPEPYVGNFTDGYQLYRNIKLYKGSIPNDITKNITDNSGFSNDSASFKMYNYASGQVGSKSLVFNGTDTFIALPQTCKINSPFTYNIWAYMDDWTEYGSNKGRIISCTESGGYNIEAVSQTLTFAFYAGETSRYSYNLNTDVTLSSLNNDDVNKRWHMFTFTLDPTTKVAQCFIDGEQKGSVTYTGTFSYNSNNTIFLGAEAAGNLVPSVPYFSGKLDDFRLYASILSEDDIKDLYKARCKVDKNQNLIAPQFTETNYAISIGKDGQFTCSNMIEIPDMYDYLTYIEARGSSYFNTGLVGRHKWYHDIEFIDLETLDSTYRNLMGYGGSGDEYWGVQTPESEPTKWYYCHGTRGSGKLNKLAGNRDIVISAYGENEGFIVNDEVLRSGGSTDLTDRAYKLFNLTADSDYGCYCRLYACSAYDINTGEPKRIYLPAKTKDGAQVGLYSVLEGKFYNISGLTAGDTTDRQGIIKNIAQISKYGYCIFNQFIEE